jgi:TadE-like protein
MKRPTLPLLADQKASTAAEFAMVLPVALIFLLGMIDAGRAMWEVNRAEKATQMAVRMAVVTSPVPSGLAGFSFVDTAGLKAGDIVPTTAYGTMTCGTTTPTGTATCTCVGSCPWGTTASADSFTAIYDRTKLFLPEVKRQHVKIEYAPSGIGYAGDPTGSDIAPIVTVKLSGIKFQPLTTLAFGASFDLPSATSSLTLEDGVGVASN